MHSHTQSLLPEMAPRPTDRKPTFADSVVVCPQEGLLLSVMSADNGSSIPYMEKGNVSELM